MEHLCIADWEYDVKLNGVDLEKAQREASHLTECAS
jgi:hypothetical protein